MKIKARGKIEFTRGDDDSLTVALSDGSSFTTGDKVYFCVKSDPANSTSDILELISNEFITYKEVVKAATRINFAHLNTINLALGTYYYDIWISWADGTYVTVVPPTEFKLVAGGSHSVVGP